MTLHKTLDAAAFVPMVAVTRGTAVESLHWGAAAVWGKGGLDYVVGSPELAVFPRSAIKPLQALPLIESGAAARYGLTDEQIALACSSHNGEPSHVMAVWQWLKGLGLGVDCLACGPQMPSFPEAAHDMIRACGKPAQLHNNCSGKHTGFLTTALHLGLPLDGYEKIGHPIQAAWVAAIEELSGRALDAQAAGTDGCSIPTYPAGLGHMAMAFHRFADPAGLGAVRTAAIERIKGAMAAHPFMVAGSDRFCTRIIEATAGQILVKTGAEGVFAGLIQPLGLGFALKIADGATRASEVATADLLLKLLGGHDLADRLRPYATVPVVTRKGEHVGEIRGLLGG